MAGKKQIKKNVINKWRNQNYYMQSIYKYIHGIEYNNKTSWCITYPKVAKGHFKTEKLAAMALDKYLISKNKQPINVLKKLT